MELDIVDPEEEQHQQGLDHDYNLQTVFPLARYLTGRPGNAHYVQPAPDGDHLFVGDETFPTGFVDDVGTDDYGDLARTIATGPATDAEPGDDWILSFTAAGATDDDQERVCVRVTPRALHELYIETKDLSADSRMAGHSGECALCGDQVWFDQAIPDGQGDPTHRRCWADAYGAPDWFLEVG